MMTLANKMQLAFEPKMPVALDATGDTDTDANLRVTLGGLALVRYKPARIKYLARTSGTTATATLKLMNGADVMVTRTLDLSGTVTSGDFSVDLSQVSGESELYVRVTVDGAGGAGESMDIDARLDIEPVTAIFE